MKTRKFMFPVLAVMIAIGAAFATTKESKPVKPVLATFNVSSDQGAYYTLSSSEHPECGNGDEVVCQISSTATPVNNQILKTQATPTEWRPAD
jgi:hypothetical protein